MVAQDPQTTSGELPPENVSSSPSASPAFWLAITALDVFLFLLLLPSLIQNDQFTLLSQVISALVASGGLFAAGMKWFKERFATLPDSRAFKFTAVGLFVVLALANFARLPVISLHPVIDDGATLDVDDKPYKVEDGTVRVSFARHEFRVGSPPDVDGKPRVYKASYGDLFSAIFQNYTEHWSPLYPVKVRAKDANLEVVIEKTDGDFDSDFLGHPEPTRQQCKFIPKEGVKNVFIWQASDNEFGSDDVVYLPPGKYRFTAAKEGCGQKVIDRNINPVSRHNNEADFESLCDRP